MMKAEYYFNGTHCSHRLNLTGYKVFCREVSELECRKNNMRCADNIDEKTKLEIFKNVKFTEHIDCRPEDLESEKITGEVEYMAIWSVAQGKRTNDETYIYATGNTWHELQDEMYDFFGFIVYGENAEPFGVEVSHKKIEELFEAMGWEKTEYYMEEWKNRLESGEWIYTATKDAVKTLSDLKIINYDEEYAYYMMRVWQKAKKCNFEEAVEYAKSPMADREENKPCRKITYTTIRPEVLASTTTTEKIMEWLDRKGYNTIVIEHPNLLSEGDIQELENILGKDIFSYKTEYICED